MTDHHAQVITVAHDVAARSARTYNMVHETDDIAGAILEHYTRRMRHFETLADQGEWDLIRYEFYRAAYGECHKEAVREDRESGANFYAPAYVRLFAMFLFAYEDWQNGPSPEISGEWTTGEAIDTAIDLKHAFTGLKRPDQDVIYARHVNPPSTDDGKVCWTTIATTVGRSSGRGAEVAYNRATEEWARLANGSRAQRTEQHQGTGSRKPLTASQGRYLVQST